MTQDKTRKSIYPPIEVVLNEETYQSRKFTHPVLIEKAVQEKIIDATKPKKDESDVDFEKKQWDAYCNWMRIVFRVEADKLEETEMSEIEDAYVNVKTELLKRQGDRSEKHVSVVSAITAKIKKSTDKVAVATETAEDIKKNMKGLGEKE